MARKRYPPSDYREWLNRAASSLSRAKVTAPNSYWEDCCFDAQQAAEKAIKAIFVSKGIKFPYVHDLTRLLTKLVDADMDVPKRIWQAGKLTRFAALTRYPENFAPVSKRQYQSSIRIATAVLEWAERQIKDSEG